MGRADWGRVEVWFGDRKFEVSVRQLNKMLTAQLDLWVWLEEIKFGICWQIKPKAIRLHGITKKMNIDGKGKRSKD